MPSPIAHLSVGFLIWRALGRTRATSRAPVEASSPGTVRRSVKNQRPEIVDENAATPPTEHRSPITGHSSSLCALGFILLLSMLPDADAVPGILLRNLHRYHNQYTHSLLVGVAVAAITYFAARRVQPVRAMRWFWTALLCYETHIVMDFFTQGRGVIALWPLTEYRFQAPLLLFYGLRWSEPMRSLAHATTLLNETVFVGLLAAFYVLGRRALARARSSAPLERTQEGGMFP